MQGWKSNKKDRGICLNTTEKRRTSQWAENDQKDKTVEKVTGEVENTDKKKINEDRYEKVCFICHRPESVTGKMIDLPNNICVCPGLYAKKL